MGNFNMILPSTAKYLTDEQAWKKYCDQLWEDRMSPSKAPYKYPCWVDRADTYAGPVLDVAVLYFMYPQDLTIKPLEWNNEGVGAWGLNGYYSVFEEDGSFMYRFEGYNDQVISDGYADSIADAKAMCEYDHSVNVLNTLITFTNYKHNV